MSSYYKNGKHGTEGGIPIWRPKWYGELGNDAEYRDAIKPREFKGAYYQGGLRLILGGVPTRVAPVVKRFKAGNKAALYRGSATRKETEAVEAEAKILLSSRKEGDAAKVAA